MSQYFSRLAAHSGVAEAAPSRLPRPLAQSENTIWGEQNAETVATSTALANYNTASINVESHVGTDITSTSQPDTSATKLVLENKRNAVADVENGSANTPENRTVALNAIDTSSHDSVIEKQPVLAASMPTPSLMADKAVSGRTSNNMLEEHVYSNNASIASSTASASLLSEPMAASKRSSPSPHSETKATGKKSVVSRPQNSAAANAIVPESASVENVISKALARASSNSIAPMGSNGAERTSSRPSDFSEVSEPVASPTPRQPTQIHIGKIELEIHAAAPKATRPAPVQIIPAPVTTNKRSAGFSASRHYLRSR
jgi:hypothetical protein